MSLTTPSKIRELQIKLYRKAKNEPGFRFYQLYDKVYREDILYHAYKLAKAHYGGARVDGGALADLEDHGVEPWLNVVQQEGRTQPHQRHTVPPPSAAQA